MRRTIRNLISVLSRTKARIQNRAVEFGMNCCVNWSACFCGTNPIVFGDRCAVRNFAILSPGPGRILFGNDCSVGVFCYLDGSGGLIVGDKVRIVQGEPQSGHCPT